MSTVLLSAVSGWAVAALTGVTVVLVYILRGRAGPAAEDRRGAAPRALERLAPHYWIGFTLAGLTTIHAGLAMSSSPAPGGAGWAAGMWVATGGMLLVFGQISIGLRLRLRRIAGSERRRERRLHFATMTLLVAAGLVHVVLNGPWAPV